MTQVALAIDDGVPAQRADNAAARGEREEKARFGMWVFLASETMFFGGLFFAYLYGRLRFPAGFGAASRATDVAIGTANTAVLLSSSFLVALALAAVERRRRLVTPLLAAAASLGVVFLALKALEYRHDWTQGLFPGPGFHLAGSAGAELFFALYFTMTGVHAVHLGIGIVWIGSAAWRARHRVAGPDDRLEVMGLYWHFVDVVWIFLYPLLYLVSRTT